MIGSAAADLAHVDTWIFDLDNTLYAAGGEMWTHMDALITAYMMRTTGLAADDAFVLQKRYLREHGTTLAGLMAEYDIDPYAFLEEVHDVPLDSVRPSPALHEALAALPGRRLVFTNASAGHAERVLARLGYAALFEAVFHLEAAELTPKPQGGAYDALVRRHGVTPKTSAFFEDTERNLAPAAALGMATVLVGPYAAASTEAFVDFRTDDLATFLADATTRPIRL